MKKVSLHVARRTLIWVRRIVLGLVTAAVTLILISGFLARKKPDLEPWHQPLPGEFSRWKAVGNFEFADYLALEEKLFARLEATEYEGSDGEPLHPSSRYHREHQEPALPEGADWNRTVELEVAEPKAGVVLLHGLSDSPYSFRSVAEILQDEGCHVACLRLPGHGTVPGGLLNVDWKDWRAAAHLAIRHVRDRVGPEVPLLLGGYSTGGPLAVDYAAEALRDDDLARPSGLILVSPAMGVTPVAFVADWHKLISWIPYFEKNRWQEVQFEYDPYKYNSFTMNAAYQVYSLSKHVERELRRLEKQGRLDELPPVLSFQSAVDTTVSAPAVVERLHRRLRHPESELVLFDVNRFSRVRPFLKRDGSDLLAGAWAGAGWPSRRTLVTNRDEGSRAVVAQTRPAGGGAAVETELNQEWPPDLFSLAHVALPFPPTDPVYGVPPAEEASGHALSLRTIGSLSPRGERHMLVVSMESLMRLRYNPFFPYVEQRIREAVRRAAGSQ